MFRIDDATAATSLPTPEAAATEGYFTEGNPVTGTPATNVRGSWLNMIQEELRAVVVAAGLTPSKTVYTQVRDAVLALFAKINGDSTQTFSVAPATAPQHAMQLGQATGRLLNIQTFNSSATYTPTPGTTHCRATVVGANASGGGAAATLSTQWAVGAGGGGGGIAVGYYPVATLSGQTVTIGAGGTAASSNGNTGGTSAIGAVLSASGGTGGSAGAATSTSAVSAPGAGGVGTGGNVYNGKGSPGAPGIGIALSNTVAGAGGGSPLSLGTVGPNSTTATGNSGSPYAGGSGACSQAGGSAQASGPGDHGIVFIEEFA